jgi:selenide,water dikinase
MLYDPQTSGGLLIAVDPADAEALLAELTGAVPAAQRIGVVKAYRGGKRVFLS